MVGEKLNALNILIQIIFATFSIYIIIFISSFPPAQGVFEVPRHGGSLVCRRRKRSG